MELLTFASANVPQVAIHYNILNKGINLINFNEILKTAYFKVNVDAYNYNIIEDYKNKDIKKLFYNYIIYSLCELIKTKNNNCKTIIYYNTESNCIPIIDNHYKKAVNYIINNISKMLPVVYIMKMYTFNTFIQKIQHQDAECMSLLENSIIQIQNYDIFNISYRKLKAFLKKNELTFLKNSYFNTAQSKLSLVV